MRLLRANPTYRRVWAGESVSLIGDQVTALALPMIAIGTLQVSTLEAGILTAASWVPYVCALPIGVITDRLPIKRHALIAADLARAGVLLTIPMAHLFGQVSYAQLLAVAALVGLAGVVSQTSYTQFFMRLVRSSEVVDANSLNATARSAANLAGPPLAGILIQSLKAPIALIVDAGSYLVSAASLIGLRISEQDAPRDRRGWREDLVAGLRALVADPLRLRILTCVSIMNLTTFAIVGVLMVFLSRRLLLSPGAIGLTQGIGATGAIVGALLAPALIRVWGLFRVVVLAGILASAPYLLLALVPSVRPGIWRVVAAGSCSALVYLGIMLFDIPINSVLLRTTPDALRGRIVGAFSSVNYGTRPVGALIGAAVAQRVGESLTVAAAGLLGMMAILPLIGSSLRGVTDLEQVPDANG